MEPPAVSRYCGLADCRGLESFLPFDERFLAKLASRAEEHRHRHAVVFVADLSVEEANWVETLLRAERRAEALSRLKASARISFPRPRLEEYARSWRLIPNPVLEGQL